jgi:opacity protein-like surface antigen
MRIASCTTTARSADRASASCCSASLRSTLTAASSSWVRRGPGATGFGACWRTSARDLPFMTLHLRLRGPNRLAGRAALRFRNKPARASAAAGAVACLLLTLASPARADAGWVIAGYLGAAMTARTYLSVTQAATGTHVRFDAVDLEGRSFSLPIYYGYRAAYFLGSGGWLGVEGEVIHMKVYAQVHAAVPSSGVLRGSPSAATTSVDDLVQRFSLSHGQNLLLVNAVLRHVFGECGDPRTSRLAAIARVGVGPTLPHVESTIGGVGDERYERGAVALQLAAGIDLRLWSRLHALAEYKFTRCRQSVSTAGASRVQTLLRTHHVVFGAAWYF